MQTMKRLSALLVSALACLAGSDAPGSDMRVTQLWLSNQGQEYRHTFLYNSQGNVQLETRYVQAADGTWQREAQTEWFYDGGLCVGQMRRVFDQGAWRNVDEVESVYNRVDDLTDEYTYQYDANGARAVAKHVKLSYPDGGLHREEYDYSEAGDSLMAAQADSIARADSIAEVEARMADSLASDPHQREYYLQQIPFTEEQLQASNDILRDALYQAGILEMERLEDFVLARQTLLRLIDSFPDVADKDNVYYHLFLICGRLGDLAGADLYKQKLLEEFPDSPYAIMLANPRYELYARQGKHIEDSLYAATYEAYGRDDYEEVFRNYATSTTDFPEGAHRAKFMFVQAMSQLYSGQRDSFLVTLKQVIEKYPKDEVTEMAQSIVKGIEEGRSLSDGKYAASDIWSRRTAAAQQDSTAEAQQLSDERLCNFVFLLAYPENSLDEDQLLYEMALYNFTSFMVRNFDIQIEKAGGIAQMRVSGFLNFDEVHAYAQKLYADPHMSVLLKNIRSVIISEDNLKLLGTLFSFDDYKKFYDEKFAPLKVPEDFRLDEPTSIEIRDPDDMPPADDEEYEDDDDGYNDTDSGIIF